MATFKTYFKKEWLELFRSYKALILCAILLFFAISTPLILYITPKILETQFSGDVDLSNLIVVNLETGIYNYLGDVYQIFSIVVLFFVLKMFTFEYESRKIVLPLKAGANIKMMTLSKYIFISTFLSLIMLIASALNYLYTGILLDDFTLSLMMALKNTTSLIIFLLMNIALIQLLSTIRLRKFFIMFITLVHFFAMPSFMNMFKKLTITPYRLLQFNSTYSAEWFYSIGVTLAIIILMIFLSTNSKSEHYI